MHDVLFRNLQKYVKLDWFKFDVIMKYSKAAARLAKWVLAIDSLYKLLRNIEEDWV